MIKKVILKIIMVIAILTIAFNAISNIFFSTNIVNDVSEEVNINLLTVISFVVSLIIIGILLIIRHFYQ